MGIDDDDLGLFGFRKLCNLLHLAARGGSVDTVDYLLSLGLDPYIEDKGSQNAIHYAASGASFDVTQRILQWTPVDIVPDQGWTPLHWACRTGDSRAIELLMQKGFKGSFVATSEPPRLWTPFDIALFHQNNNLAAEEGDTLDELIKPLDTQLRTALCGGIVGPSSIGPENLASIRAQKHGNFWCNGCFHVGFSVS